jgi:hypothetical protein
MNDDLERIWKEAFVAYLRYYSGIYVKGLRNVTKNSIMIADVGERGSVVG